MRREPDHSVAAQANLDVLGASRSGEAVPRSRSQDPVVVGFWIITMRLVPVSLSTLKLT